MGFFRKLFNKGNSSSDIPGTATAFNHPNQDVLYLPYVKSWVPVRVFKFNDYFGTLYTDIEGLPQNQITYVHIIWVWRAHVRGRPCFATACETNDMVAKLRAEGHETGGSYTLGVFPCDGSAKHKSLEWSDKWADLDTFFGTSLAVIAQHFKLTDNPQVAIIPESERERQVFTDD